MRFSFFSFCNLTFVGSFSFLFLFSSSLLYALPSLPVLHNKVHDCCSLLLFLACLLARLINTLHTLFISFHLSDTCSDYITEEEEAGKGTRRCSGEREK